MFLRRKILNGTCYYDLRESYRDENGDVRHRVIVSLGRFPDLHQYIASLEAQFRRLSRNENTSRRRLDRLQGKLNRLRSVVPKLTYQTVNDTEAVAFVLTPQEPRQ
jgi:hypothetical protein